MTNLELKRLEVELIRVQAARAELEFKIVEREDDIDRMKQNIQIQINKENEIKQKLEASKGQ